MVKEIIAVKIGTNILTTTEGNLDLNRLRSICQDICQNASKERAFIIVTSAAITCGSQHLSMSPTTIPEKQASAAVGQFLLMKEYARFFKEFGQSVGQILLTKEGLEDPKRLNNIKNTISTLIGHGVVPIINENDSVSTDEIQFGDNDKLSALVAVQAAASRLIILSDIDGLYTSNPKKDTNASLITRVDAITTEIFEMADADTDGRSRGGMTSKLEAASVAVQAGIDTVIAHGATPNVIGGILKGQSIGTFFPASQT